jgi:UDP-apiose/xylose synthase
MQRIAVLGAGGFLGSHLVTALLRRDDVELEAVDLTFNKLDTQPPAAERRLRRVVASVGAPGLIDGVTARNETVVSMTALCNPSLYNTQPLEVIDANYTDLVPLVQACAARGRRLVHFSTCEVYGRAGLDVAGVPAARMNEETTGFFLGPVSHERWTYAAAKQLLERLIWAHGAHARGQDGKDGPLDFTIIRPFNVIGPRMDFLPGVDGEGIPRVLASFMGALLRGDPLPLVDGGRQRRSFISVQEFTDAVVRVIERPEACRGQVLNLGNPENDVSIRELALALARAYVRCVPGAPEPTFAEVAAEAFYGPGYDDTRERIPDVGRARRLLDWAPRTTLAEMLPAIVEDYVARYGADVGATAQPLAAGGRR